MLTLNSPAKINLFLRIVNKRSDGFHNLSSVFQTIQLCDTLTFEKNEKDILTCTDSTLPVDNSNLVMKAVHLFRKKTKLQNNYKIHLTKKIPSQAGLGGGSGNAATTLWALNQLEGEIASTRQLQEWSAEIGSDIPFFFSEGTAYCTGRGEIVHNLLPNQKEDCLIVKPAIGLSTPEIFSRYRQKIQEDSSRDLQNYLSGQLIPFNDLEQPAFELRPELKMLKDQLQQEGFQTVLMSGSGSAFFCLGNKKLENLNKNDLFIFSTRFLNRSPLTWY